MTQRLESESVGWDQSAQAKLSELVMACGLTQAIYVAVQLGIPELLQEEPKSTDKLAKVTSSDAWTLAVVLRLLAAFEVLREDPDGRYSLTEVGTLLVKSSANSMHPFAISMGGAAYQATGALLHAVMTGQIAFEHTHAMSFYEHLGRNPAAEERFGQTMRQLATLRYANLTTSYNFSAFSTIVDVGGGEGGLTALVLKANPQLRAILFDSPEVISRAKPQIDDQGLSARCELVAGSFLETVPKGGDLYVLANDINNWRHVQAGQILRNCREAMGPQARMIVIEPATRSGW